MLFQSIEKPIKPAFEIGERHTANGIRSTIRKAYQLDELPDRKQSEQIARSWHPHATIASWYLWRSLES